MDCRVRRTRGQNDYTMSFKGLTRGAIMAMKNALELHSHTSSIAADIMAFLRSGIESSGDEELVLSVIEAPELAGERITTLPIEAQK